MVVKRIGGGNNEKLVNNYEKIFINSMFKKFFIDHGHPCIIHFKYDFIYKTMKGEQKFQKKNSHAKLEQKMNFLKFRAT